MIAPKSPGGRVNPPGFSTGATGAAETIRVILTTA